MIPHSHLEASWQKTPGEYYQDHVIHIYSTVIEELEKDETRTFTCDDVFFFQRWWKLQNDETKDTVKRLVAQKQFEFVNGGWVSSDEACPSFSMFIENLH